MLIESHSGVRGYFQDGLDRQLVERYAIAFYRWCGGGSILIGRDSRSSGKTILSWLKEELVRNGAQVLEAGIVPTPTVQLLVEHLRTSGGIVITASHNPLPWNGLKFISSEGVFLDKKEVETLIYLKENAQRLVSGEVSEQGVVTSIDNPGQIHIHRTLKIPYVDLDKIRQRRFRVVFDAVNGAGYEIIPALLQELNCEVITLNTSVDKSFPRDPEPLPQNLVELCSTVKKHQADIGFAVDPDADRLAIVSDLGKTISEEYTLVLATMQVLKQKTENDPVIVTNLSTTRAMDDICNQYNATLFRTPIGEIEVVRRMKKEGAIIGGEGNGGVILPDLHYGRDSLAGIILVLGLLAESGKKLSEIFFRLPHYSMKKYRLEIPPDKIESLFTYIIQRHSGARINTQDGVKIDFPTGWVHLRKSNTEPIVRIYTEARTESEAELLASKYINLLKSLLR